MRQRTSRARGWNTGGGPVQPDPLPAPDAAPSRQAAAAPRRQPPAPSRQAAAAPRRQPPAPSRQAAAAPRRQPGMPRPRRLRACDALRRSWTPGGRCATCGVFCAVDSTTTTPRSRLTPSSAAPRMGRRRAASGWERAVSPTRRAGGNGVWMWWRAHRGSTHAWGWRRCVQMRLGARRKSPRPGAVAGCVALGLGGRRKSSRCPAVAGCVALGLGGRRKSSRCPAVAGCVALGLGGRRKSARSGAVAGVWVWGWEGAVSPHALGRWQGVWRWGWEGAVSRHAARRWRGVWRWGWEGAASRHASGWWQMRGGERATARHPWNPRLRPETEGAARRKAGAVRRRPGRAAPGRSPCRTRRSRTAVPATAGGGRGVRRRTRR
jgi:hypothetical protein